jgi:uncharacterized protein YukE
VARQAAGFPTGKALKTVGRMRRRIIGAGRGSVDLKNSAPIQDWAGVQNIGAPGPVFLRGASVGAGRRVGGAFSSRKTTAPARVSEWHGQCKETFMATKKKWSARVTKHSDAMDLKKNVFRQSDPKKIARSVKKSAARSTRRKSTPKRSAMSMLSFYVNRAGKNLSPAEKKKLQRAKKELRKLPD